MICPWVKYIRAVEQRSPILASRFASVLFQRVSDDLRSNLLSDCHVFFNVGWLSRIVWLLLAFQRRVLQPLRGRTLLLRLLRSCAVQVLHGATFLINSRRLLVRSLEGGTVDTFLHHQRNLFVFSFCPSVLIPCSAGYQPGILSSCVSFFSGFVHPLRNTCFSATVFLFFCSSKDKFDSNSGWPTFSSSYGNDEADKIEVNVLMRADNSLGISRTEVICKKVSWFFFQMDEFDRFIYV